MGGEEHVGPRKVRERWHSITPSQSKSQLKAAQTSASDSSCWGIPWRKGTNVPLPPAASSPVLNIVGAVSAKLYCGAES